MVKSYIISGYNQSFDLKRSANAVINRENLTEVTSVILYDLKLVNENIKVFTNELGASISIQEMGNFDSKKLVIDAYENNSDIYDLKYKEFKEVIHPNQEDSDWNMLLIIDPEIEEAKIGHNYCLIKEFDLESYLTFNFIDACMIYQSLLIIQKFINGFKNKSHLTKLETYLIGYYLESVNSIKSPYNFVVNEKETRYLERFYEKWNLKNFTDHLIDSISTRIQIYDFISKYENNKKNKITSRMLTILTVILGFTTIFNFFKTSVMKVIVIVIFGIISLLILIASINDIIKFRLEKRAYKQKV